MLQWLCLLTGQRLHRAQGRRTSGQEREGCLLTHLLGSQVLSNTQLTKARAPATVAAQQRDKQKTPAHCWKVVHDADLDQVPETFRGSV